MRDGPERCLDLAAECRELAESSLSVDARQRWLKLADTWLSLHAQVVELAELEKRDLHLGPDDDTGSWH
jgi:hypothetical protein